MRIQVNSLSPMSETQQQRLAALGELHYHDAVLGDTAAGEICNGAEILITTPRLAVDIVPYLDQCRFVSVQAAGSDAIDLAAARRKGIVVSNVPEFCTDAAAEHAFALLLGAAKKLELGRPALQEGRWNTALAYPTIGMRGKTLGLFGCGKIGSRIAGIARGGFQMRVMATVSDPSRPRGRPVVPFQQLLSESDFLVIAAPATAETRGIFGRDAFAQMRPSAILVNISRAALVDDAALLAALDGGQLAAAGLDVFLLEPPATNDPLLSHPKILVSPHVAWGTEDAVQRLLDLSIANVEAFLAGEPVNVVS